MMKKIAWICILLSFLALSACSHSTNTPVQSVAPTPSPTAASNDYAMMSGYPKDVLPPYNSQKITYCMFFSSKQDIDPLLGAQIYTLKYNTDASKADIFSHYEAFLTNKNKEESGEYQLVGTIHSYPVIISTDIEDGALSVTLTVGPSKGK